MKKSELRQLIKEEITSILKEKKFNIPITKYITYDRDKFKKIYDDEWEDWIEDNDSSDLLFDFIKEYSYDLDIDLNIDMINKYYGRKLGKYGLEEIHTDFFEADGMDFISSDKDFEKWLERNREYYF